MGNQKESEVDRCKRLWDAGTDTPRVIAPRSVAHGSGLQGSCKQVYNHYPTLIGKAKREKKPVALGGKTVINKVAATYRAADLHYQKHKIKPKQNKAKTTTKSKALSGTRLFW